MWRWIMVVFPFTPKCVFTKRHTFILETLHKAVSLCICTHADVSFKVQRFSSICCSTQPLHVKISNYQKDVSKKKVWAKHFTCCKKPLNEGLIVCVLSYGHADRVAFLTWKTIEIIWLTFPKLIDERLDIYHIVKLIVTLKFKEVTRIFSAIIVDSWASS